MKQMLCSIDISHEDDAKKILAEAAKLATVYQATLNVVTVVPDYGSSWVGSFFKEGTLKLATQAAMEKLHELTAEIVAEDINVKHIVEVGNTYEQVLKAAEQVVADLIVVGAHKPDLASRIVGPNASRVVRFAQASVLVVRV